MSHYISKCDFGKHEDCTYVIKCSGSYKLKENISFKPKHNKVSAILIDAEDVILDLNGKVLKQSSHSTKTQVTGITVKTGHRNVTILGSYGTVKDFSQRGIYVEGGNDFVTLGDNTQLTVSGCGYGTERSLEDQGKGLIQCGVQLGDQEWLAAANLGSFNGVLNQLVVKNITSSGNNIGCVLGEGSDYTFSGSSFSGNFDNRLVWDSVATLGGFYQEASVLCYGLFYNSNPEVTPPPNVGINNIKVSNCKFNGNFAEGNDINNAQGAYCNGFLFTNNFKNLKVESSQFNQNATVLGANGVFNETIGLVIGAGVGTVIENSEFSDNKGGSEVIGCSFSGLAPQLSGTGRSSSPSESVTVRNCVSSRNLAQTDVSSPLEEVDVRGFSLKFPSGATLIDCVSEDNKVLLAEENKDSVFAFSNGIFIFSDQNDLDTFTNNVEIRGCKLSRNRVTSVGAPGSEGPSLGSSSGIRVFDDLCENIVIRDCVISDNQPDFDEPQPSGNFLTTGLDLFNVDQKTGPSFVTVCNNLIQSNGQVGIDNNLVSTHIQGNKINNHGAGVLLSGDINGDFVNLCGTVIENTFLHSDFAVVDDNINNGFSTTIVADNKSYNTPFGYEVFYGVAHTLPTKVVSADIPNFPAVPDVSLANIQLNLDCADGPQQLKVDLKKYREGKKAQLKRKL